MKKAGEVGESNCSGNIHANLFARTRKFLREMLQRLIHIAKKPCGFAGKEFVGWCDAHRTGCPFEQLDSKTIFNTLHLTGEGTLRQSGTLRGLGKTAMFNNELK